MTSPPRPGSGGPAVAAVAKMEPLLEGVVLSDAVRRKMARDEAYRATPDAVMRRTVTSS
jgi:hypothetical protein